MFAKLKDAFFFSLEKKKKKKEDPFYGFTISLISKAVFKGQVGILVFFKNQICSNKSLKS